MKVIKLSAIDSTNTYLKQFATQTPKQDEVVVVATSQKNGRGQRGAAWQSQDGKSLTFSVLKRFEELLIAQQTILTFVVSLAIVEVLDRFKIPDISIKWPNDIMSQRKKLAGILVENQIKGNYITSSVVGVGLNVNEIAFSDLPQATSMMLASGVSFQLDEVLDDLAVTIFKKLRSISQMDISKVKNAYENYLFRKAIVSVFEIGNLQCNGRILGVTSAGQLRVAHEHGEKVYDLKEVRLLY